MKRKHGLTIKERLEHRRIVHGECWELDIDKAKKYPQLKVDGKKETAHRLAYEAYIGPIPPGLCVLHRCDNPRCHRPEHLFLGTLSDNMRDMWEKQRHSARGPSTDESKVLELIDGRSQQEVATLLGVSQTCISRILIKYGKSRGRTTGFRKNSKRK